VTTYYVGGLYEENSNGSWRRYYNFNRQVIAQRDNTGTLNYLHGDHLGSVSTVTNSSGGLVSSQKFDPWGKVRSGVVNQTILNHTGQKLDGTGLLFYNTYYCLAHYHSLAVNSFPKS
jgi:uncharacterized protein RhaS with RHS repeats